MERTDAIDTIKEYLTKDFNELKSKKGMSRARALNKNEEIVLVDALPLYFVGKMNSKTVMVNLNPGNNEKFSATIGNINSFVDNYIKESETASAIIEKIEKNKKINSFDKKSAAFLLGFEKRGFNIDDFTNKALGNDEKKAVVSSLKNKLQLEFIPYASSNNNMNFAKYSDLLVEYTNFIFDTIFSESRNCVIFASRKFDDLFKVYKKNQSKKLLYSFEKLCEKTKKIKGYKNNVHCMTWNITRKSDSKSIKVVVAATFPNQSLINTPELMKKYGEFCAECLS